jgi:acetyl esterase/lipase
MKKTLITLILGVSASLAGAAPTVIQLWPEGVPGIKADIGPEKIGGGYNSNVSEATLTMVGPAVDRPNGTAVIICPGGGYVRMSTAREGDQYANWLSTLGVTSFVLKYRMQEYGHPAPLQDVLRAVRMLRSRAAEFNINPARIGVMGSSAGGHLAASAGTLFDNPAGRTGAAMDAVSARPDFLVLLYPVNRPSTRARARRCWAPRRRPKRCS